MRSKGQNTQITTTSYRKNTYYIIIRIVLYVSYSTICYIYRGWRKFSLADIKKIFCKGDLWSKISHVLCSLKCFPHKFTTETLTWPDPTWHVNWVHLVLSSLYWTQSLTHLMTNETWPDSGFWEPDLTQPKNPVNPVGANERVVNENIKH